MISVIVPARNAERTLPRQLEALGRQDYEGAWEVLVVDNGSVDSTAIVVDRYADRVAGLRLIDAAEAVGINFARNAGVRASSGSLLLFCDADDEVRSSWVSEMVKGLAQHDAVGGHLDVETLNRKQTRRRWRQRRPASPSALQFLP